MPNALTVEEIATSISATPYSIQIDGDTRPRLLRMAKLSQRISERYEKVRPRINTVIAIVPRIDLLKHSTATNLSSRVQT